MTDVKDSILGSVLGSAVGDALGAPVEGLSKGEIASIYGQLRDPSQVAVFYSELTDPQAQTEALQLAAYHLQVALEVESAYADALGLLARIQLHFGDTEQAQKNANTALLIEPHNRDAPVSYTHLTLPTN